MPKESQSRSVVQDDERRTTCSEITGGQCPIAVPVLGNPCSWVALRSSQIPCGQEGHNCADVVCDKGLIPQEHASVFIANHELMHPGLVSCVASEADCATINPHTAAWFVTSTEGAGFRTFYLQCDAEFVAESPAQPRWALRTSRSFGCYSHEETDQAGVNPSEDPQLCNHGSRVGGVR